MKIANMILVVILACFAEACQSVNMLTLSNSTSRTITIQIQTPYQIDTTEYVIPAKQEKIIQPKALTGDSHRDEFKLKAIIIKGDSGIRPIVWWVSNNYMEMQKWKLSIPLSMSNLDVYKKLTRPAKLAALVDHSLYFLVQELFNSQNYAECFSTIVDLNFLSAELARANTPVRDSGELQGYLLLAHLSALRSGASLDADNYWQILAQCDSRLAKSLQQNILAKYY